MIWHAQHCVEYAQGDGFHIGAERPGQIDTSNTGLVACPSVCSVIWTLNGWIILFNWVLDVTTMPWLPNAMALLSFVVYRWSHHTLCPPLSKSCLCPLHSSLALPLRAIFNVQPWTFCSHAGCDWYVTRNSRYITSTDVVYLVCAVTWQLSMDRATISDQQYQWYHLLKCLTTGT